MKRQIRTSKDQNGDKLWLGCTVSFEDRLWKVRNIVRLPGREWGCSVELEEDHTNSHSSATTYASAVLLVK